MDRVDKLADRFRRCCVALGPLQHGSEFRKGGFIRVAFEQAPVGRIFIPDFGFDRTGAKDDHLDTDQAQLAAQAV